MLFFKKNRQKNSFSLPSFSQWSQFFKILPKSEKILFIFLIVVFLTSLFYSVSAFYYKNTELVPSEYGTLQEGMVGQPQFINPLYAQNSEIDKALLELIFSGLVTFNDQGKIIPDLINEYHFTDDGKTFEFSIKENAKWHDGENLTMDDVIFTFGLIQDPTYLSPLQGYWTNVEIVKNSEYKGFFKLKQPYSNFMDNLANIKIMPKHIWEGMPIQAILASSDLNLASAIGSGPYMIDDMIQNQNGKNKRIRSISLARNVNYYNKKPYIQKINITFLFQKDDLSYLLKSGALDAGFVDSGVYNDKEFKAVENKEIASADYFGIFLNNQKENISNSKIREALSLATNKQEILSELSGHGYIVNSPILSEFYEFPLPKNINQYDLEKANNILNSEDFELKDGVRTKIIKKSSGFELRHSLKSGDTGSEVKKLQECLARDKDIYPDGTTNGRFGDSTKAAVIAFQEKYADEILKPSGLDKGTGKVMGATMEKLNSLCFTVPEVSNQLVIRLKTVNNPTLKKVALKIKEQWGKIGIKVEISELSTNDIKKVIRDKDYDAILFGEKFGSSPELLPYWHSSQIFDPGWNLAVYQNDDLDKLLEKSRLFSDGMDSERIEILDSIQNKILEDNPAIFLYSTNYNYLLNKKIKGFSTKKAIDQSRIFDDISNWYISEKRVWKQK
ncbi:MAG: ABC transporter substrate-binding protein [Candidatus Paceibacterota bacterium]|jgi:peptide/nickel transport system substrate-binding protein|nr:ABC transporter substrate-binding protein [bacterium]